MKKPTTKSTISSNTRKLTLARQTMRHLTAPELARAGGGENQAPQPTYGQLTITCFTCVPG
jgi:hypothetical protein